MNFTKTEIRRNIRKETNFIAKCESEIKGLKFAITASRRAKKMWEKMLSGLGKED